MDERRSETLETVQEVLGGLRAQGVPIVQLRHRDLMSANAYEGDHDFLLDARCRAEVVRSVLEALVHRRRFFLLNSPVHPTSRKSTFHVLDESTGGFVTLEFWHEVVVRHGGRYARLTWKDLEPVIVRREEGHALDDVGGTLLFLTHLHAKGKRLESPLVQERLDSYRSNLLAADAGLRAVPAMVDLIDALVSGRADVASVSARALELLARECGVRLPWYHMDLRRRRLLVDGVRQAARRLTQRCVIVVGPDGSGKSTMVDTIKKGLVPGTVRTRVFKRLFRDRLVYKAFLRWQLTTTREQRNIVDERAGGWLAVLALPPFVWAMLRHRRCTQVFDRYFYDFLMVGVRRSDAGEQRWRRRLLPFVPTPGLVLNPLADHDDTVHRRDALSASGFRSYESQLLEFVAAHPPRWFAHAPAMDNVATCQDFALRAVKRARVGTLTPDAVAAPQS